MTRLSILTLVTAASLITAASLAQAQSYNGGNQGSSSQGAATDTAGTYDGANPDSAPITCASRACMDRQAAATSPRHYVVTHVPNREPRKPRKPIPVKESERCQDRWVQWPNGLVIKERDCQRPLEYIIR